MANNGLKMCEICNNYFDKVFNFSGTQVCEECLPVYCETLDEISNYKSERITELEDALHVILAMSDIKYVHDFCSKKLEETEAAK